VDISDILTGLNLFATFCARRVIDTLTSPVSRFSLLSLGSAFLIATTFLLARRSATRPLKFRVLVRALIPRRWYHSASARADFLLMAINLFLTGLLFGWALLSADKVEQFVTVILNDRLGGGHWIAWPKSAAMAVLTLTFYLAFELAYFIDHYLSHHIPILWHFHRVHHTAETLSPVTVFRVHPVDTIIFYNLTALCIGIAMATVKYFAGARTGQFQMGGINVILLSSLYLISHLQHSEMWIAFTGRLGRLVLSPAHHQIHHSADPAHYNRNFGNSFAVFDWIAGSLYVPAAKAERLKFGADPSAYDVHSVTGLLVMPFADAAWPRDPAVQQVNLALAATPAGLVSARRQFALPPGLHAGLRRSGWRLRHGQGRAGT
jgi:sterol desaturase/sphingolipid hydroxylase (fatty acid hydroxylase superfamily)